MSRFLPYGRQTIDEQDIEAVVEALRHDLITTGPGVRAFERAFADCVGANETVAVSNGTAPSTSPCSPPGWGRGTR